MKLGSLEETIVVSFDPTDERAPRSTPVVREVAMPARKPHVSPVYPSSLRGTGTEGVVVMEARIGADGDVGDIQVVGDAHPDLALAAIAAVRDWRYTETLLNCEPMELTMTVTLTFKRIPLPPPPPP